MSSGSALLCSSAHRQHLWAFRDGAGRLPHLAATALTAMSRLGLGRGFFVQCIGGEKTGREEEMSKLVRGAPSPPAEGSQALPEELRSSPMAVTFAMH